MGAALKASDDQAALQAVGAALGEASDLLQVGLQVDAAQDMSDMREDVMALMQEQGDAARAEREALERKLDEVLQRQKAQWGSANEHAQLQRGDLDALMGEMRAAMAQMSLAARKDPSATAADLGVRAKVALVVGVAAYEGQPLRNPVNDARDVALALRACDFSVELALDVTLEGFEEAQARFEEHLAPGTLALPVKASSVATVAVVSGSVRLVISCTVCTLVEIWGPATYRPVPV